MIRYDTTSQALCFFFTFSSCFCFVCVCVIFLCYSFLHCCPFRSSVWCTHFPQLRISGYIEKRQFNVKRDEDLIMHGITAFGLFCVFVCLFIWFCFDSAARIFVICLTLGSICLSLSHSLWVFIVRSSSNATEQLARYSCKFNFHISSPSAMQTYRRYIHFIGCNFTILYVCGFFV